MYIRKQQQYKQCVNDDVDDSVFAYRDISEISDKFTKIQ